eukprot:CAMPEP_0172461222 /NCGR_PEP_ID=MMETSP1065-20121228/39693_1 /TAXON_ID=265537 /ORGANISM="Amphiprora paludosa, Strain CCMP125" /LENGTH=57 /DNA_ID=CAMNT_0013216473 /DNA_START=16 /DNA_END=189 /DNA_ORIENTATION=-
MMSSDTGDDTGEEAGKNTSSPLAREKNSLNKIGLMGNDICDDGLTTLCQCPGGQWMQ